MRRRHQLGAVLGIDDAVDQLVDGRILDADQIARAGNVGGGRAPIAALLVAGRQRLAPGGDDDVEVPLPQPVLVLRGIDRAHRDADAEPFQRRLVEQHHPLHRRIVDQQFDRQLLLGLHIDHLGVFDRVTGLAQKPQRLAQVLTQFLRVAPDRIGVGLRKHFRGHEAGGHLFLDRLEDVELLALGRAGRGKLGTVEIAVDALVLAVEKLPVHFLEIEGEIESAAQVRALELVAPDVEGEGLHDADVADGELVEHHLLLARRREIVGRGPVLGAVLAPPVDLVALERLQRDGGIAVVLVADGLEIVGADHHVEVLAPIIGDALVDDGAAGREVLQPVRAGTERRLQRRLRHVALAALGVGAFPPVLGQDRQLADDLRQLAIAGAVEVEGDLALAGLLGLLHVAEIGGVERGVLGEALERPDHIFRRHRLAVLPARDGAQAVGDRRAVGRIGDGFRQQTVVGGNLVERRGGQAFGDEPQPARQRAFDAGNDLVEVVEGAEGALPQSAADRRLRVDVVEMLEAGGVFRLAEERQPVLPGAGRRFTAGRGARQRRRGQDLERRRSQGRGGGADEGPAAQFHEICSNKRRPAGYRNQPRLCRFFGPPPVTR